MKDASGKLKAANYFKGGCFSRQTDENPLPQSLSEGEGNNISPLSSGERKGERVKGKLGIPARQKAFTLAEILIALTVIGVISAVTVPVLMQNTNKQEYVTALRKAHSTLSQAANQMIAENGSPKCTDNGWACTPQDVYDMFKKYLNNAKDCEGAQGCFAQNMYKKIGGGNWSNLESRTNVPKLVLLDGMQLGIEPVMYKNCSSGTDAGISNWCAQIYIDINGAKKPNVLARDLYSFMLTENGIRPSGCDTDKCRKGDDRTCTCKVLKEGAMNY